MSIVYLEVPFDEKEEAKVLGAQRDDYEKRWYCSYEQNICVEKWKIKMLCVKYDQREEAKAKGAKWDPNRKMWYTYQSNKKLLNKYNDIFYVLLYDIMDNNDACLSRNFVFRGTTRIGFFVKIVFLTRKTRNTTTVVPTVLTQ